MTTPLQQLIGGAWLPGSGDLIESRSPSRPGDVVASGLGAASVDVDKAVSAARDARTSWASTTAHDRGAVLARAAEIVAASALEWGAELAWEEGKTRAEGIGEVRRAGQILSFFAHDADRESGELYNSPRNGERIMVLRRPVGTVAIITPFNFPIAIPAWKIAPALAYGNTIVWKPAGPVPLLALRLASALVDAGLPAGVLNLLIGDAALGAEIAEHSGIEAISFTGSTVVGRQLASRAALRGIPVQAEMGGKNAAIVLEDADVERAVNQIMAGAFNSAGQKCTATSRLVVAEPIADELIARLIEAADQLVIGDPLGDGVQLGPVISAAAESTILEGIAEAIDEGAVSLGVSAFTLNVDLREGHFVAPAILDCTGTQATLWNRELFGPVLAVKRVHSAGEAFAAANEGDLGLSAAVFTGSLSHAMEAMDQLDVGMLHLNSETAGADPHVPFGGSKGSSLGPKEQGRAAREFFSNTTTVYLRAGA
ncbi:aldehyde dehydrogenase family protein [Glaciihabitans sp. UYNi722]|uniref:aldehyde dehydrogenase family protein n=1 Tax=Glaciihabitans sp. UYNi722 TaxID=3156344 RepID=UPI003395184C